jgi:hypothetical protein
VLVGLRRTRMMRLPWRIRMSGRSSGGGLGIIGLGGRRIGEAGKGRIRLGLTSEDCWMHENRVESILAVHLILGRRKDWVELDRTGSHCRLDKSHALLSLPLHSRTQGDIARQSITHPPQRHQSRTIPDLCHAPERCLRLAVTWILPDCASFQRRP